MRKKIFILLLFLFLIPYTKADARQYMLKSGKSISGTYAGEEDFNYYQITSSKGGFLEITAKTSDKKSLLLDICDENKEVTAANIEIPNGKTVFHRAEGNKIYYLRVKGTEGVTYNLTYKVKSKDFAALKYAKKYNYIFTNASLAGEKNALMLKMKTSKSGILHFMCETDNTLMAQYCDGSKKKVSGKTIIAKHSLSGIGVKPQKEYYIKLWNNEDTNSGTCTLKNVKYQIKLLSVSRNDSRGRSVLLDNGRNKKKEALVVAGEKNTFWYKVKLYSTKKLSLSIESRLLQNNGSYLLVDLYNSKGTKMTDNSIVISDKASANYKGNKYIMNYPKKKIVTGNLPANDYYVRVVSKTKTTSGSFCITLN